jgi:hypothetical protein
VSIINKNFDLKRYASQRLRHITDLKPFDLEHHIYREQFHFLDLAVIYLLCIHQLLGKSKIGIM